MEVMLKQREQEVREEAEAKARQIKSKHQQEMQRAHDLLR
jgi:hypothetical protein